MANQTLRTVANQDGAVVLDISRGTLTTLNTTGAHVWQALEQGQDLDSIIVDLAQQTGQNAATIKPDVLEFVKTLQDRQLLSHKGGAIA